MVKSVKVILLFHFFLCNWISQKGGSVLLLLISIFEHLRICFVFPDLILAYSMPNLPGDFLQLIDVVKAYRRVGDIPNHLKSVDPHILT